MICKQTTNHEVFNFLLGLFEENAGVINWAFVFLFFFATFCQNLESRPRANGVRPDQPGYESIQSRFIYYLFLFILFHMT